MRKPSTSSKKREKKVKKQPSVQQLISQGETAMEAMDTEKALFHYQAAIPLLSDGPELADILAKSGECKVSLGDQEGARDDFEQAISLLSVGHERACLFLYVGQLSLGEEALEAYEKAITELEGCIKQKVEEIAAGEGTDEMQEDETQQPIVPQLKEQLMQAHCNVAELYLTDLCFAEGAEQACESHAEKAMQLSDDDDEPSIDALQVMASLRLSQQREAKGLILQAYAQIKTGCEALATLVGLNEVEQEEAVELTEVDAASSLPSFEFRCQMAKILLECTAAAASSQVDEEAREANGECVRAAIQVLGSLMAENDEVSEIWYLLGCAFEAIPNMELAVQYWQQGLTMLQKIKQDLADDALDDDAAAEELNDCEAQIEKVQQKLSSITKQAPVMAGQKSDHDASMDES